MAHRLSSGAGLQTGTADAGKTLQIPFPPGDTTGCAGLMPISQNYVGEILGRARNCYPGYYFTNDPINGTQNLSDEFR